LDGRRGDARAPRLLHARAHGVAALVNVSGTDLNAIVDQSARDRLAEGGAQAQFVVAVE
jgi:hypothetical protein